MRLLSAKGNHEIRCVSAIMATVPASMRLDIQQGEQYVRWPGQQPDEHPVALGGGPVMDVAVDRMVAHGKADLMLCQEGP